jgi:hypothetical protein
LGPPPAERSRRAFLHHQHSTASEFIDLLHRRLLHVRGTQLSAYLGQNEARVPLIRWDCQVWLHGQPLDYMASGTRYYGWRPAPVELLDELVAGLSPDEVTGYTVWGSLLVGGRSRW